MAYKSLSELSHSHRQADLLRHELPLDQPLKVMVTGHSQNPSLITAVNVIVTIPVDGSCEHDPVGVPTTLSTDQSGNISV